MDFDAIRPILTGLVGAAITFALMPLLTTRSAVVRSEQIARRHRGALSIAKVLSFIGMCAPLLLYFHGILSNNDWRGVGLSFGLSVLLPLLFLLGYGRWQQVPFAQLRDASFEGIRPVVAYTILVPMLFAGIWAILSLFGQFVLGR